MEEIHTATKIKSIHKNLVRTLGESTKAECFAFDFTATQVFIIFVLTQMCF